MDTPGRRVRMGRIVGVSGVRGEVKLESWAEPRDRIFEYQPWQLVKAPGAEQEIRGVEGRTQGKGLVASLPGVDDRDAAVELVGSEIFVARELLPAPEEDEYYWVDLEGLEVVTEAGKVLGRVHHLFATGANDVMVVRGGERELLVPFVLGPYVKAVHTETGRIEVDWDPEF